MDWDRLGDEGGSEGWRQEDPGESGRIDELAETSLKKHCFTNARCETVTSNCAFCKLYWCKVEIFVIVVLKVKFG